MSSPERVNSASPVFFNGSITCSESDDEPIQLSSGWLKALMNENYEVNPSSPAFYFSGSFLKSVKDAALWMQMSAEDIKSCLELKEVKEFESVFKSISKNVHLLNNDALRCFISFVPETFAPEDEKKIENILKKIPLEKLQQVFLGMRDIPINSISKNGDRLLLDRLCEIAKESIVGFDARSIDLRRKLRECFELFDSETFCDYIIKNGPCSIFVLKSFVSNCCNYFCDSLYEKRCSEISNMLGALILHLSTQKALKPERRKKQTLEVLLAIMQSKKIDADFKAAIFRRMASNKEQFTDLIWNWCLDSKQWNLIEVLLWQSPKSDAVRYESAQLYSALKEYGDNLSIFLSPARERLATLASEQLDSYEPELKEWETRITTKGHLEGYGFELWGDYGYILERCKIIKKQSGKFKEIRKKFIEKEKLRFEQIRQLPCVNKNPNYQQFVDKQEELYTSHLKLMLGNVEKAFENSQRIYENLFSYYQKVIDKHVEVFQVNQKKGKIIRAFVQASYTLELFSAVIHCYAKRKGWWSIYAAIIREMVGLKIRPMTRIKEVFKVIVQYLYTIPANEMELFKSQLVDSLKLLSLVSLQRLLIARVDAESAVTGFVTQLCLWDFGQSNLQFRCEASFESFIEDYSNKEHRSWAKRSLVPILTVFVECYTWDYLIAAMHPIVVSDATFLKDFFQQYHQKLWKEYKEKIYLVQSLFHDDFCFTKKAKLLNESLIYFKKNYDFCQKTIHHAKESQIPLPCQLQEGLKESIQKMWIRWNGGRIACEGEIISYRSIPQQFKSIQEKLAPLIGFPQKLEEVMSGAYLNKYFDEDLSEAQKKTFFKDCQEWLSANEKHVQKILKSVNEVLEDMHKQSDVEMFQKSKELWGYFEKIFLESYKLEGMEMCAKGLYHQVVHDLKIDCALSSTFGIEGVMNYEEEEEEEEESAITILGTQFYLTRRDIGQLTTKKKRLEFAELESIYGLRTSSDLQALGIYYKRQAILNRVREVIKEILRESSSETQLINEAIQQFDLACQLFCPGTGLEKKLNEMCSNSFVLPERKIPDKSYEKLCSLLMHEDLLEGRLQEKDLPADLEAAIVSVICLINKFDVIQSLKRYIHQKELEAENETCYSRHEMPIDETQSPNS